MTDHRCDPRAGTVPNLCSVVKEILGWGREVGREEQKVERGRGGWAQKPARPEAAESTGGGGVIETKHWSAGGGGWGPLCTPALLQSFLLWTFSCSFLTSPFFLFLVFPVRGRFLASLRDPRRVLPACHMLLTGCQREQSIAEVKENIKIRSLCNQNPHPSSSHSAYILSWPKALLGGAFPQSWDHPGLRRAACGSLWQWHSAASHV